MSYFDPSIVLDHMVINVRFQMDEAQSLFEGLGFQLTPRGHHSLGSINHLMMFGSDYLELLGLPPGSSARPELSGSPMTIDGLVFKTEDVDATYEHMRTLGMDGDPPKSFTRPLEIDGEAAEAAFRTVTVRSDVFGGGRVYFCEHATPQYLWHTPWMVHGNGVERTHEFVVVSVDPEAEAARYGALVGRDPAPISNATARVDLGGAALAVMSQEAYRDRFGDLALACPADTSIFGAISFGCGSLDGPEKVLGEGHPGCRIEHKGDTIRVAVDTFNALLEFRA
jgi:hypothetical protein